jgi:hypothetical protein
MKLLWRCPVQVRPTLGSSHYLICSWSEVFLHKAICNFYGEDKGKEVGDDVCVELLSVPTQGPAGPSRSFLGVLGKCCLFWLRSLGISMSQESGRGSGCYNLTFPECVFKMQGAESVGIGQSCVPVFRWPAMTTRELPLSSCACCPGGLNGHGLAPVFWKAEVVLVKYTGPQYQSTFQRTLSSR